MEKIDSSSDSSPETPEMTAAIAQKRRDALKKIAVFGAYTTPFMLGLLSAKKAVAATCGTDHCGGNTGGCCSVEALLASGQRVGDATPGSPLKMMHPDGSGLYDGAVERIRTTDQPCVTFSTQSGIALTLSLSTPIAVRRDGMVDYPRAIDVIEGDLLPVEDAAGFRWEPLVAIADRGMMPVSLLSANNGVYAAGDAPGRLIYTHNIRKQ